MLFRTTVFDSKVKKLNVFQDHPGIVAVYLSPPGKLIGVTVVFSNPRLMKPWATAFPNPAINITTKQASRSSFMACRTWRSEENAGSCMRQKVLPPLRQNKEKDGVLRIENSGW
jgi:hypothetical protein